MPKILKRGKKCPKFWRGEKCPKYWKEAKNAQNTNWKDGTSKKKIKKNEKKYQKKKWKKI